MRPYLAVIKDSFREALASRVLWILSGCIVLLLLALAPIGYRESLTTDFLWGDISDGPALAARIREQSTAAEPSPGKRIWSLFDVEARQRIEKLESAPKNQEGRDFLRGMEALRQGLNKQIAQRDFYSPADWQEVRLNQEAKDLLAKQLDKLSTEERTRFHRLAIEAAYPGKFAWRSPKSLAVSYLGFATPELPFIKNQIDNFIKEIVLTQVMGWIVGVFGMIAAILVTSPIIPQMFEPGSITLLLSKPVSRSLLLSAKFLGGCAFVLINVTLLIVGLWLIVGTRFGIWNEGMMWCIPIFLFMFLIYYAVSAFTGLIWKSAIVSVVVTVLFWILCFVVDLTHTVLHDVALGQERINHLVEADGQLITANEATRLQLWDEEAKAWRTLAEPRPGGGIPIVEGPFYHQPSGHLLVGQGVRNPFGGRQQRVSLRVASAADGWKLRDGPALPSGTSTILMGYGDTLYAIAADQIYRFRGDPSKQPAAIRALGYRIPLGGGGEFEAAISGGFPNLPEPRAAAADPDRPRLVVCAGLDVYLYDQDAEGKLTQVAHAKLEGKENEGSVVAITGETVLVAQEQGQIFVLSATDLSTKKQFQLETDSQPRLAAAAPDGSRIALLFQNRNLWLIDAKSGEARRAPVSAQGEISGLTWSGPRLLVGDYANRVVAYDAEALARQRTYQPALSRYEIGYYYIIQPLYTIFPKPRMLNRTVQYVLTGKRTTDMGLFQGNLAQQRDDLNPWQPVKSGLAFVAVVLLLACVYIERHEF